MRWWRCSCVERGRGYNEIWKTDMWIKRRIYERQPKVETVNVGTMRLGGYEEGSGQVGVGWVVRHGFYRSCAVRCHARERGIREICGGSKVGRNRMGRIA